MPDAKIAALIAVLDRLPRWAVLVLTFAAFAFGGWWLARPSGDLVSLKAVNEALRESMAEYTSHLGQTGPTATLMDDARGKLAVTLYADGCTLLERTDAGGQRRTKLVIDPARDTHQVARRGGLMPVLEAATICDRVGHGAVVRQSQRQAGALVFVYRVFADGCEHEQAFDPAHGVWMEPRWTICRH